jgi:hypothetical protein
MRSVRHLAEAVDKLLLCSTRCLVDFGEARELVERPPELLVDVVGAITHHREAAATLRTFWAEGCNHDVTARLQSVTHGGHISGTKRVVLVGKQPRLLRPGDVSRGGAWYFADALQLTRAGTD